MYAPRARHGFFAPLSLLPLLVGLGAIAGAILLWAFFHTGGARNDDDAGIAPVVAARSVVYSIPREGRDFVYVRPVDGRSPPRLLTSFPTLFGLEARGTAAPTGDRLAVLHIEGGAGALARLTLVPLRGEEVQVAGGYDYLSRIAWAPDGRRLALTRALDSVSPGRGATIFEVDALTGAARERVRTGDASQVAPVGYSNDGQRLFIVIVDQAGSSLWALQGTKFARLTTFSAGLTRDWVLSPDGRRLAFVDRLGAGERSYAGRVLTIVSGEVGATAADGDQLGAVWRPGNAAPDFGGPAGNLRFSDPEPGTYLIPVSWTSDGAYLVATVVNSREPVVAGSEQVEILSAGGRVRLSETPRARFLGLVRDE